MRHDRPEETRRALLDAGRRLIVERRGHEIPSTVDICAAAGLSRGALYARFADREHYLEDLLGEILDGLFFMLTRPMVEGPTDPRETVREFIAIALDREGRVEAELTGGYLAVLGVLDSHAAARERHVLVMHALIDHLEEVVLRGQTAGTFRPGLDRRHLAGLLALIATSAMVWADLGIEMDHDRLIATTTAVLGAP